MTEYEDLDKLPDFLTFEPNEVLEGSFYSPEMGELYEDASELDNENDTEPEYSDAYHYLEHRVASRIGAAYTACQGIDTGKLWSLGTFPNSGIREMLITTMEVAKDKITPEDYQAIFEWMIKLVELTEDNNGEEEV